jgi:hypothetical protein
LYRFNFYKDTRRARDALAKSYNQGHD